MDTAGTEYSKLKRYRAEVRRQRAEGRGQRAEYALCSLPSALSALVSVTVLLVRREPVSASPVAPQREAQQQVAQRAVPPAWLWAALAPVSPSQVRPASRSSSTSRSRTA